MNPLAHSGLPPPLLLHSPGHAARTRKHLLAVTRVCPRLRPAPHSHTFASHTGGDDAAPWPKPDGYDAEDFLLIQRVVDETGSANAFTSMPPGKYRGYPGQSPAPAAARRARMPGLTLRPHTRDSHTGPWAQQ